MPKDAKPCLRNGQSLREAVKAVSSLPVEGILLSCSNPESILASVPVLRRLTERPFGALAHITDDLNEQADVLDSDVKPRQCEDLGPEAYRADIENWLSAGADVVGGCCKVVPTHITHLRAVISDTLGSR